MLKRLFAHFTNKARSPDTAVWLSRSALPFFMQIAQHYQVVSGPRHVGVSPFGIDDIYLYGVTSVYGDVSKVFYFKAPFNNLPRRFWPRM
jgi:hypothetical protein